MKRSEMIENIKEILEELIFGHYDKLPDWELQADSQTILERLEKLGMLPPYYEACILTRTPKPRGGAQIYDWEPED